MSELAKNFQFIANAKALMNDPNLGPTDVTSINGKMATRKTIEEAWKRGEEKTAELFDTYIARRIGGLFKKFMTSQEGLDLVGNIARAVVRAEIKAAIAAGGVSPEGVTNIEVQGPLMTDVLSEVPPEAPNTPNASGLASAEDLLP